MFEYDLQDGGVYFWVLWGSFWGGCVFEQKESNEMDKYEEMAQLFKLLASDMKAKDSRIKALENDIDSKTVVNDDQTRYQFANKNQSQNRNSNKKDHSDFYETTREQLQKLQDLVHGLEGHLVQIGRGLSAEKYMRVETTKSAKILHDHLNQMFENLNLTLKRHEELIQVSVKTLEINIKANTDKTTSCLDKINSVTTQMAESQRENRRSSDKLAEVLEKINNDMDIIKPMVLNTLNVNFALGKSASESSSFPNVYNKGPNAATDGSKSGIWTDSSCTHTNGEINPWWQVDLEKQYLIKRVVIKNREDCCGWQLHSLLITVSKDKDATEEVCGRFKGPGTLGATVTINCTNAVYGRFLKIQIQSKNAGVLTLCEVEIFSQ